MRNPEERCLKCKLSPTALVPSRAQHGDRRVHRVLSLAPELFARFTEAARFFGGDQWTTKHEQELDQFLVPLFWTKVIPHINNPLNEPD
ncbi:hypothetical protein CfE428DRAFT_5859 [Chthoniobacter flavus Ellin428]|uniref:Uncharacterized protein n=1 Tax=Chthoniobacter flavus Ellin428 TaxID=497964 RepID=B4DAB9_9BACT|nr:hypothetical protein CfE428DRAFT_5859 [Chthoniobacter flavus Ellin428]TCO91998.1 hypothetical protein EV701_107281 [Chthoniobacter flavus]